MYPDKPIPKEIIPNILINTPTLSKPIYVPLGKVEDDNKYKPFTQDEIAKEMVKAYTTIVATKLNNYKTQHTSGFGSYYGTDEYKTINRYIKLYKDQKIDESKFLQTMSLHLNLNNINQDEEKRDIYKSPTLVNIFKELQGLTQFFQQLIDKSVDKIRYIEGPKRADNFFTITKSDEVVPVVTTHVPTPDGNGQRL